MAYVISFFVRSQMEYGLLDPCLYAIVQKQIAVPGIVQYIAQLMMLDRIFDGVWLIYIYAPNKALARARLWDD